MTVGHEGVIGESVESKYLLCAMTVFSVKYFLWSGKENVMVIHWSMTIAIMMMMTLLHRWLSCFSSRFSICGCFSYVNICFFLLFAPTHLHMPAKTSPPHYKWATETWRRFSLEEKLRLEDRIPWTEKFIWSSKYASLCYLSSCFGEFSDPGFLTAKGVFPYGWRHFASTLLFYITFCIGNRVLVCLFTCERQSRDLSLWNFQYSCCINPSTLWIRFVLFYNGEFSGYPDLFLPFGAYATIAQLVIRFISALSDFVLFCYRAIWCFVHKAADNRAIHNLLFCSALFLLFRSPFLSCVWVGVGAFKRWCPGGSWVS